MSNSLVQFDVGTLDLGSFADDAAKSNNGQARPLTKPGTYQFTVTKHKLSNSEKLADGAGKAWGSLYISAETAEGYFMSDFVQVPLESLDHVSKGTKKVSQVPTKIFLSLMGSILGRSVNVQETGEMVSKLNQIIDGAKFIAEVGHRPGARVSYMKDVQGDNKFGIILRTVDGVESDCMTVDGQIALYATRDEAKAAYLKATGTQARQGLSFLKFVRAAV